MILPGWILLGCLAAQPAAGRSLTSERFYHSGLQAMKTREYKLAMVNFMDALLIDPDYPDARERLREAGNQLLRVEQARAKREREYLMVEINAAEHSMGESRRLSRGTASETPEASERPPELMAPPPEEDETPPPPPPTRRHRPARQRNSAPNPPTTVAGEGGEPEAAPAGRVRHLKLKQTVHVDLDWLKPAQPSLAPPPDTGELYLKGIRAYSAGDLPNAIAAWEQCLKLDPSHAKARKALERAKREAEGGKR